MAHLNIAASQIFGSGRQYAVIDSSHLSQPRGLLPLMPSHYQHNSNAMSNLQYIHKLLGDIIDSLGHASANAQGLPTVITTASKLSTSPDQRLYLLIDNRVDRVVGLLKTGKKRLFIADPRRDSDALVECQPLCILDFYVVEGQQRRGHGRRLCDLMLEHEQVFIGHVAVDRPSPKMVAFLARHYGLSKPFTQRNNFTVFESFFTPNNPGLARASSGYQRSLRKCFSSDCITPGIRSAFASLGQHDNRNNQPTGGFAQQPISNFSSNLPEPRLTLQPGLLPPLQQQQHQSAQMSFNNKPLEGRERFVQPMSADMITKNKPPIQERFRNANMEPPLLSRGGAPDSYRQLYIASAATPPPNAFQRNVDGFNYPSFGAKNSQFFAKEQANSTMPPLNSQINQNYYMNRGRVTLQPLSHQSRPHMPRPY